jgi:two-component system sensor histidine kinase SenX3
VVIRRRNPAGGSIGSDPVYRPPAEDTGITGHDPVEFTDEHALTAGRLRAALDQVEEGVVICDGFGETLFRNLTATRLLTASADAILAEQAVGEALMQALKGEYPERVLELLATSQRRLIIRAFPLTDLARPDGAVAIVQDASDRHRLENIRRDFVANVSHELKTPVGALSLLAETLDGEDDPIVVERLAKRVAAEAERLGRIIDDLLDLSRIEDNDSPRPEMVPVTVIVGQAVEPLRPAADSSGVRLEVDDPPRHLAVPGDRRDLVSAVSNLVDNAIKYSERDSLVQVRIRSEPEMVEIAVTDEGVGIPARDMERIFERFYRVDRARSRSTGGTGLGLSIVRHVAVNHAGSVRVESREGEGSTFTLRLPARSRGAVPSFGADKSTPADQGVTVDSPGASTPSIPQMPGIRDDPAPPGTPGAGAADSGASPIYRAGSLPATSVSARVVAPDAPLASAMAAVTEAYKPAASGEPAEPAVDPGLPADRGPGEGEVRA